MHSTLYGVAAVDMQASRVRFIFAVFSLYKLQSATLHTTHMLTLKGLKMDPTPFPPKDIERDRKIKIVNYSS